MTQPTNAQKAIYDEEIKELLQPYEEMQSPFDGLTYIQFMEALSVEALNRANTLKAIMGESK